MKTLLLTTLLILTACASGTQQGGFGSDVRNVEVDLVPFTPAKKITGIDAQKLFEASVAESEGMTQSEFSASCIYIEQAKTKRILSVTSADESIEDPQIMALMCKHAWPNYAAVESPDHDDEDGNGMSATLYAQCERIEEPNRPLSYECELMQPKPVR